MNEPEGSKALPGGAASNDVLIIDHKIIDDDLAADIIAYLS